MMDEDPRRQGLLSAALAGLAASGPSSKPVSLGQTLGMAGNQGLQTMREGQQFQNQREMRDMQMKQMRMQQTKFEEERMEAAMRRQQQEAFAANLPPEQRALFNIDPQAFMQQRKPMTVGRSIYDPVAERFVATDPTVESERVAKIEERRRELEEQHTRKLELMGMQNANQAQIEEAKRQHRIDMFNLAASFRQGNAGAGGAEKAPSGFRFTPTGDLERIPGGPADIKSAAELQKKADGAGDVDVALGTLRDAYTRLEKGGGITSVNNAGFGNIFPSISSSPVGQATGRLFGTQNQSARNDIAMARPALLAALMKATGMSAKQMDSNAELKLWLSTATDPTLDVESNRRALDNIERKFLSGSKATLSTGTTSVSGTIGTNATSGGIGSNGQIDELLRKYGKPR
jgi:hypothetical protein